ncbi:cobalt-precorrin-4/precorrin-4 C(11)-methyltransferase [Allobranchiibius sp. CTAmp26]|uniref:cobalt-precorrin-4/precorrin-4 C(11)-methyltransferase n=1 Tax=Allobranchiibius sp. CTAmp26 TaxID=2815214 RepID=UPI001AA0EBC0|nr:SAM-dependent methyltransferase [Allobranchiibius sp. CTAmp26]MBO1756769.1 precorrin-4 C(11)-methyltransferase [Allobranchiibius sp. CTAmp26]
MTVHFIGAGPGAADLLTLRAVRLLEQSPVCLYAGTYLDAAVLGHCPAGAELVDTQHLNLDAITEHLVAATARGADVARLCSGDPSVYSAIAEQTRRLDRAGVAWDVTPGVPAYAATAALVGRELTVPEVAQSVVLTRVQKDSTKMPAGESLEAYAATGATLVLHLAIRHIDSIVQRLTPHYGADCPVVIGSQVSQPAELVLRGTLANIAGQVHEHALRQAAVILVGPALGTRDFVESHLYSSRPPA